MTQKITEEEYNRKIREKQMVTAAVKLGAVHELMQTPLRMLPELEEHQEDFLEKHVEFTTNFFEQKENTTNPHLEDYNEINVESLRSELFDDTQTVQDPKVDAKYDLTQNDNAERRKQLAQEISEHCDGEEGDGGAIEFTQQLYQQALVQNAGSTAEIEQIDFDRQYLESRFEELRNHYDQRMEELSNNYFEAVRDMPTSALTYEETEQAVQEALQDAGLATEQYVDQKHQETRAEINNGFSRIEDKLDQSGNNQNVDYQPTGIERIGEKLWNIIDR